MPSLSLGQMPMTSNPRTQVHVAQRVSRWFSLTCLPVRGSRYNNCNAREGGTSKGMSSVGWAGPTCGTWNQVHSSSTLPQGSVRGHG